MKDLVVMFCVIVLLPLVPVISRILERSKNPQRDSRNREPKRVADTH